MDDMSLIIQDPAGGEFLRSIRWNKQELVNSVNLVVEQYKGLVYTDKDMKMAKADRAKLNALKKDISDRRIEVKNAIMAPYSQFEKEVKEVVELIDEPLSMIDSQIKEYEHRKKEEKRSELNTYFDQIIGDKDFPKFEDVFDEKMLNSSMSISKAKEAMDDRLMRISNDLKAIEAFALGFPEAAKDIYKKTKDLSKALEEDKRLYRLEEERKEREEAERRKIETEVLKDNENEEQPAPTSEIGKVIDGIQRESFSRAASQTASEEEPKDVDAPTKREKQYKTSFTVYGTKEQIMAVKRFMEENGIKFGKVEK